MRCSLRKRWVPRARGEVLEIDPRGKGYRLLEPPFGLSQLLVGLVFLSYLAGTLTAPTTSRSWC